MAAEDALASFASANAEFCRLSSLLDEEEEPYKSKYSARAVLVRCGERHPCLLALSPRPCGQQLPTVAHVATRTRLTPRPPVVSLCVVMPCMGWNDPTFHLLSGVPASPAA
jgi:hypothetical protein